MRFEIVSSNPGPHSVVALRFEIPFCIHLQDNEYQVVLNDQPHPLVTKKVWRNSEDCMEDDEIPETRKYFAQGTTTSSPVGSGERFRLIGKNVEMNEDARGRFRGTEVSVGLLVPPGTPLEPGTLLPRALYVVNRFVDCYRYLTGRAYIPPVQLNDIDFVELVDIAAGEASFTALMGKGLTIALVNETRSVHDRMREMISAGTPIPAHAQLLLSARRLLGESLHRQAVIEAVGALELAIGEILQRQVDAGQLTESEYDDLMENKRISERLKGPMRMALERSPADDGTLWGRWLQANKTRRHAVHRGSAVGIEEADHAVDAIEELITFLLPDEIPPRYRASE